MINCIKRGINLFARQNVNKFVRNLMANRNHLQVKVGLAALAGAYYLREKENEEFEEKVALYKELQDVRGQLKNLKPTVQKECSLNNMVLRTKDENIAFEAVLKVLDDDNKVRLNNLLTKGVLLRNDSDNETSVLENLHAIVTTPRAEGLDAKNVLNSVVRILDNPSYISQTMDNNFPLEEYGLENYSGNSNTCAAASIEYDFADKNPAEFIRFVNELTSSKLEVKKVGNYDLEMLQARNIPYRVLDNGLVEVVLKPDKKALSYAQAQTKFQDEFEGSAVDILFQLTIAKLRMDQEADYLSSVLGEGGFQVDDIVFVENIVKEKNVNPIFYHKIDDKNCLCGSEFSTEQIKEQILGSLEQGENVIAGMVFVESDRITPNTSVSGNSIVGGHEIVIVGYKTDYDGRIVFKVQNSDDSFNGNWECPEEYLLPRLNHAFVTYDVAYNLLKEKEEMLESKIGTYFSANI